MHRTGLVNAEMYGGYCCEVQYSYCRDAWHRFKMGVMGGLIKSLAERRIAHSALVRLLVRGKVGVCFSALTRAWFSLSFP